MNNENDIMFGKCPLCGIPFYLRNEGSLTTKDCELSVCADCLENEEILEKVKIKNNELFNEVNKIKLSFKEKIKKSIISISYMENGEKKEEHVIGNIDKVMIDYEHIRLVNGCPQWLSELSIDELRKKAKEYRKPSPPKGIEINGKIIYENKDNILLENEEFKKHPFYDLEVSNLGRIKQNNRILEQYDPDKNDKWKCGYLKVKIQGIRKPEIEESVYKLVADTWLKKPENDYDPTNKAFNYCDRHHISNNGYDNRKENLIFVTKWQHAILHPNDIKLSGFNLEELNFMLDTYKRIKIIKDDYKRILDIANNIFNLENDELLKKFIKCVINSMEELINVQ